MATIHEAARAGDVVALLSFLDADALALNARDRHSRTPLHLASWAGHADVVHTLCCALSAGSGGFCKCFYSQGVNKAGKKAIDLAKDDECQRELQAVEASSQAVESMAKKTEAASEGGTKLELCMTENKDDQLEDPVSQGDVSPPKKKSKVQLSHLGTEQEFDESN
ncbi:hypothetical protein GOP47_0009584 [Adiantum capillus-veneris]|uniref:Uncharacterized protein n=1 Tax=Adiantum capillus-veneris TaxID=13818 RepID=A0A9D4UWU2_ADICA|nr:hypothetical protein GOP47_0009584 [Adiantum capillus-veneris]